MKTGMMIIAAFAMFTTAAISGKVEEGLTFAGFGIGYIGLAITFAGA